MTSVPAAAGLCAVCMHARPIESARGSVFILCGLSQSDPRFPRYPRLPVVECGGFAPSAPPPEAQQRA